MAPKFSKLSEKTECHETPEAKLIQFPGGRNDKYAGLEDLDVGSKFRMFERKSASPERPEHRGPASDRFGIMEKLKRLQV